MKLKQQYDISFLFPLTRIRACVCVCRPSSAFSSPPAMHVYERCTAHAILRSSKDQTPKCKPISLVTDDGKKKKHLVIPACDTSFKDGENEGLKFSMIASSREVSDWFVPAVTA